MPVPVVFLNYRRSDAPGVAGRLYDALVEAFGREAVFRDIDAIPPGADFAMHLMEVVDACDVMLVLIGPGWLGAPDDSGGRRLDDPGDWVRAEIAAALAADVRIIPVLTHGASMPAATELPADLAPLARRNAVELTESRWEFDVGRLIDSMAPGFRSPARGREAVWKWIPVVVAAVLVAIAAALAVRMWPNDDSESSSAQPPATVTAAEWTVLVEDHACAPILDLVEADAYQRSTLAARLRALAAEHEAAIAFLDQTGYPSAAAQAQVSETWREARSWFATTAESVEAEEWDDAASDLESTRGTVRSLTVILAGHGVDCPLDRALPASADLTAR